MNTPSRQLPTGSVSSQLPPHVMCALERAPQVAVPADFAARVAAALPSATPTRRRGPVARMAAIAAAVVLAIALFVLAPHAAPSFASIAFDVELMVLAQLAAIVCWLATKREV